MKWSDGHNWIAELPYAQTMEELKNQNKEFEFKFIVKHDNGGHFNVVRWENGENHLFNGKHIQ